MCTNKSWIVNSKGKKLFVKCGKCPACLQEKAIARANRIRAAIPEDGSMTFLFVTLTYSNLFVPYFDYDEFKESPLKHSFKGNPDFEPSKGIQYFKHLNIYRNASVRAVRADSSYSSVYKIIKKRQKIASLHVPADFFMKQKQTDFFGDEFDYKFDMTCPMTLRHNGHLLKGHKVSVCYYKDIQDFFKRLRINLSRHYHYEDPFVFYSCSEYGETYARAHFHLLIGFKRRNSFSQSEDFTMWQSAIVSSWPYADRDVMSKSIEIARNAASYVASYVNCSAFVHPFLASFPKLRPKNSYSRGFGSALRFLSYEAIFEAYRRGDLHVDLPRIKDKCLVVERVLLPKYVISRAFPLFKGYCNLTFDEIVSVCFRPSTIRNYVFKNEYSEEDCHKIEVLVSHKRDIALSHGLSLIEFANMYAHIWTVYRSNVMRDWYESIVSPFDYVYAYDNIKDFYDCNVSSPSLEEVFEPLSTSLRCLPVDANFFPLNYAKTSHMTHLFHKYRKDRRIRNYSLVHSVKNFNI